MKKTIKKEKKVEPQVIEIHIYVHQMPNYTPQPNYIQPNTTNPNNTLYPWGNPNINFC